MDLNVNLTFARYEEEMASYTPPEGEQENGKRKRKGKNDQQDNAKKVKRPLSGYMYFCKEKRPALAAEHPDMKMVELSKMLGQMWKELSDEEKRPFDDLATADKRRYEDEVKGNKAEQVATNSEESD